MLATAGLAVLLSACSPVHDAANTALAERMIESALRDEGSRNVAVRLHDGQVTASGVDARGQAFRMEVGDASVTEHELQLPFYPRSRMLAQTASRIDNAEGRTLRIELQSGDSVRKVADWYRQRLEPRSTGPGVVQRFGDHEALISLAGTGAQPGYIVSISASDGGSRIALTRAEH